jgi:hypothetical protein
MQQTRWRRLAPYVAGLLGIFLLLFWKYDFWVAGVTIGCFVVGFINAFGLVDVGISLVQRRPLSREQMVHVAAASVGNFVIAWLGYWIPLLLVTACALLVRFSSLHAR